MTLKAILLVTLAGMVLGGAYALSPMTVWFAAACVGLLAWAGQGLPERERRWVHRVLTVAILLRVLVVVGLFLTHDPDRQYFFSFFFDGDGKAFKLRSMWISSFWSGGRVHWFELQGAYDRGYGWSSYTQVLAYVQYLIGPAPYGIHLMNIALFSAGGIIIYRYVRLAFGGLAALVGLALLLFMPSLFLWSLAALKESLQFFLMATTLIAALHALGPQVWWKRLLAAAVFVLAIAALSTVRRGGLELAALSLVLGAVGAFVVRRRYLLVASVVLVLVGGYVGLRLEAVQTRVFAQLQRAVTLHIGNVRTEGHAYKTLDQRRYTEAYSESVSWNLTEPEAVRFVLRSLLSFVFVPLPWALQSTSALAFLPAQIAWYATFVVALAGFLPGLRRHALLTLTIAAYGLVGASIVGLNNGNVGTLVRLRDVVTPFLVWLTGMGAAFIFVRVAAGRVPHVEGADRAEAEASRLVESSKTVQWFRRITAESRVWLAIREFFTRPIRQIDAGIPQEEERLALAHLAMVTRHSRVVTMPAALLERFRVAWSKGSVAGFVERHVGGLSTSQQVRLVGWVIAVAVVSEALSGGVLNGRALPFALGAQLMCIALACLFMFANHAVATAWLNWKGTSAV